MNPKETPIPIKKGKPSIKRFPLLWFAVFVFISIFSIELGLECGYGLGRLVLERKQNTVQKKSPLGACTILALGESTTATGEDMSWPSQLERIINTDMSQKGTVCHVINKGIVGTNSTVILSHIQEYLDTYKPAIVISMMGINDYALYGGYEDPYGLQYTVPTGIPWKDAVHRLQLYRVYRLIRMDVNDFITFHMRRNVTKLIDMSNTYREKGDYTRSEKAIRRAIAVDPQNDWAWDNYGWLLRDEFRYEEAEEKYLMAIAVNHTSDGPYVEAANFYRQTGNFEESKRMYDRALQINPDSAWAYDELGNWYQDQQQYQLSEIQYRNAMEKDKGFESAWFDLGTLLRDEGRLDEAAHIYATLLTFTKNPARVVEETETLSRIREGTKNAATASTQSVVNDVTKRNYQMLQKKLSLQHIPLVAVQYPTKPVGLLLDLFTTDTAIPTIEELQRKGVYIVDNEMVFKDALETDGYDALFIDHFGGTFGHATPKGNGLLARNIVLQVESILLQQK